MKNKDRDSITKHDVADYLRMLHEAYDRHIDLLPVGSVGAARLQERRSLLIYATAEVLGDEAARILKDHSNDRR
jgi:hypothetical protein